MKQSSANTYQKKLLIALLILKPIAYFLKFNSCKLPFKEPRRMLLAPEMLMPNMLMSPNIHIELFLNKPALCKWILIRFFNKPDHTWSNKQGGADQNQNDPISIRITRKISGKLSLNI